MHLEARCCSYGCVLSVEERLLIVPSLALVIDGHSGLHDILVPRGVLRS
jgi:hypothetical protein